MVTIESPRSEPQIVPPGSWVWTGSGARHDEWFIFRSNPASTTGPSRIHPSGIPPSAIFVTEMPKPPPVCQANPVLKEKQRGGGGG